MCVIRDILLTANLFNQRYSFDSKLYMIENTVLTTNVCDQRYSFDSKAIYSRLHISREFRKKKVVCFYLVLLNTSAKLHTTLK
jgi:hypothetical protein